MSKEKLRAIIGENIKARRIARGMTTDELAELLDLSTASITMIEAGRRGATIHTLYKLSEIFKTTIDEMFYENSNNRLHMSENNPIIAKREKISAYLCDLDEAELDFLYAIVSNFKKLRNKFSKSDENQVYDDESYDK